MGVEFIERRLGLVRDPAGSRPVNCGGVGDSLLDGQQPSRMLDTGIH